MRIPLVHQAQADAMSPVLRRLLEDELDVGNAITEVGHCHPAPPIGAWFKLARQVSTRARNSGQGLTFRARNSSMSSGEFTDADRRYWIVEPPVPRDGDYPDMDAIRASVQPEPFKPKVPTLQDEMLSRFAESKQMNFERWKEGSGYDLVALDSLSPDNQRRAERQMTPPGGWRDVEALAALDSPTARETLRSAVHAHDMEICLAVLSCAPELLDDDTRTHVILRALTQAEPFTGQTETLDLVMEFHPPLVVQELFVQLLRATGEMAYHCAATLTAIHGVVDSRYDWSLRPLYLAFNTDDAAARRQAFLALCQALDVDGAAQLAAVDHTIAPHQEPMP